MPRVSQLASVLSLASSVLAALPIPSIIPFAVQGPLDLCAVDPVNRTYNSGGSIKVNGFNIQVPKNLIAQLPALWVPFEQLCAAGVLGNEVSVLGNQIDGQAIAAQISIAPFLIQNGQGYIDSIDTEKSELKIRGGPIVRINDPDGVYGHPSTDSPLFQADGENPSIASFSGFPMCIPRNTSDPLCPSANRPDGSTIFSPNDPLLMAPFKVGDFIEFSGIKKTEDYILAYAITAVNVQITTSASSTVPNYIRMEDAIIGVFDAVTANNIEFAPDRFVGYLSSCAGANIFVDAIDVDPCTGEETFRQIAGPVAPRQEARCKFDFRFDPTDASIYTREYRIRTNNPIIETKNNIQAGQYVQPVTEWIQPEVDTPGTEPPPYRFRNIRGLVQGDFLDGKQFGPLSPFPGPAPPAPSKTCSPDDIPNPSNTAAPIASVAAIPNAQRVGANILLRAANAAPGIPTSDLVFTWTKTSPASPSVSITNAGSATATIVAPSVAATGETTFTFQVSVSRKSNPSQSSTATLPVKVSTSAADDVVVDFYSWESKQSGTIQVNCTSSVVNGDNKKMSLVLSGNTAGAITMTRGASPGKWSYGNRSTNKPSSVQCVSDLKGKSEVVTGTTGRRRRGAKRN